jgi:hypothetical protein
VWDRDHEVVGFYKKKPLWQSVFMDGGQYYDAPHDLFFTGLDRKVEYTRWVMSYAVRNQIGDWVERRDNPFATAVVRAIARGEVECEVPPTAEPPTRNLGELNTPHIEVATTRRRRRRRRGVRVPILAGEISRRVHMRLGSLEKTPENELLVRADVSRTIEGLHKLGEPEFVNLRYTDMDNITDWASKMFWIESVAEEDIREYEFGFTRRTEIVQPVTLA